MQPDRQVAFGQRLEDRKELGFVERAAAHVGEKLHAARAQLTGGPLQFAQRGLDVVHGQRRHEGGKAVGVLLDQLGHALVGQPRQLHRLRRRGVRLDGRRGQREDLAVVVPELIHHPEAAVQVVQGGQAAHPLAHVPELAGHLQHAVEEAARKDVREDIELHGASI